MDKAEASGFGVAVAGHGALLAALSLGFAGAVQPPVVNAPIEVSFVDEIGLTSAVTEAATEPPAASVAPTIGAPEEPVPEPLERAAPAEPTPRVQPTPAKAAPKPAAKPAPAKPAPPKASAAKPKEASGSRLGKDFLKGIGSDAKAKGSKPTGAVMNAQALSSIAAAIQRQIQPCANQQVNPGPGANRITVRLNLKLNRDGSLAGNPVVVGTVGVDDENGRYERRVRDLAIAAFKGCAPLRGLPDELYDVPGGWNNLIFRYKLP